MLTQTLLRSVIKSRTAALSAAAIQAWGHCYSSSSSSSSSSSLASHSAEDALYSQGAPVEHYKGVVAALLGSDRGRGLVARHSFEPGDLVMCVQPAAIVQGEADEQPDPELLVPALLEAARQPHVLAALNYLYDGTDDTQQQLPMLSVMAMDAGKASSSSSCCPDHGHDHGHHHHGHEHGQQHGHHSHQHHQQDTPSTSGSSDQGLLSLERAAQIVRLNAFGDAFEDLAAAAVRGSSMPSSHVGCWPAFCLINHSCVPNTVHYVVGEHMVVRATEDVPAGQELTVSYLGREDFAPVGARRAVLQERYGFNCDCQRCRLELRVPEQLQQHVEETFTLVQQEMKPAFMKAVEQQDAGSFSQVHAALQEQEDQLGAALQEHSAALGPTAVLVLQAAVYDLYELLLFADQLGPGSSQEVAHRSLARLGRCVSIINCVAPGSELHVYLTSRMLQHAVELRGADSVQAEAAAALLQEAHLLRYGKSVSQEVMLGLMEANKQAARDFLI